MKTIFNHQPLLTCEKELSRLSSLLPLPQVLGLFTRAKKKLLLLLVRVGQDLRAALVSLVLASTVNSRVYVGLLLMTVATPLASCSHLLFSRDVVDPEWFYRHYFDLFLVIGPYLSIFFALLGVYLWLPLNNRAKGLFIPIGLTVGKILWLLQITSNDEFWHLPSISFLFYGLLIGSLLPMVLDHLVWRKFHDFDGKMARIEGLANILTISEADKAMLIQEIKKAKAFSF
jgi:hypothetical protein